MDDFDEALSRGLKRLDAAVPPAAGLHRIGMREVSIGRRGGLATRKPIGLLTAGVVLLIAAVILASGLSRSQEAAPSKAPGPTDTPVVLNGPDGLPVQIDGQRVFRLSDEAEWLNVPGSFLLAARLGTSQGEDCIAIRDSGPEGDLIFRGCGSWYLENTSGDVSQSIGPYLAPKGLSRDRLWEWLPYPVVLRVHTHDAEAAECGPAERSACEAAIVVEAVAWPTLPDEIAGEHVYRFSDILAITPTRTFGGADSSFLLGGVVSVVTPDWSASYVESPIPCTTPESLDTAWQKLLLLGCYPTSTQIGRVTIAPESGSLVADGRLVIVRAHFHDPLASACPAGLIDKCNQAIVVESVVWSSNPYKGWSAALPTPTGS